MKQNFGALGIVYVLQANVILQAKTGGFESYLAFSHQAKQYLDLAEDCFIHASDEEGLSYCKALDKKISKKIVRKDNSASRKQAQNQPKSTFLSPNASDFNAFQDIKTPKNNQLTINFGSAR